MLTAAATAVRADVPSIFSDGDDLSAAKMNANFKNLSDSIAALKGEVDTLKGQVAALDSAKTSLEGRVSALEADNLALKAQLEPDPACPAGYTRDSTETTFTVCTKGKDEMVKVGAGSSAFWIDRYEASVWDTPDGTNLQYGAGGDNYPPEFPDNIQGSGTAYAISRSGFFPSADLTWFQATAACASSGKRLPDNAEWTLAATGTPDPGNNAGVNGFCVTGKLTPRATGEGTKCRSNWGAEDMIGNLWEIIREWGFSVGGASIGTDSGLAISDLDVFSLTAKPWPGSYNDDGSWGVFSSGYAFGLAQSYLPSTTMRGGGFNTGVRAGVFSFAADNAATQAVNYAGFRCVIGRSKG